MTTFLDTLEASATKATPGPWFTHDWENDLGTNLTTVEYREQLSAHDSIWPNGVRKHRIAETSDGENPIPDAAFIALANPDNILALVRVARAAQYYASDPDALDAALDALPK